MRLEIIREGRLNRNEIDELSGKIGDFLKTNTEKELALGLKLSLEDKILSISECLGEDTQYSLATGTVFRRPFVRFCYSGVPFDPCSDSDNEDENWSNRIISDMGLSPIWRYKNNENILELRLQKKKSGSIASIAIAIILSIILGFGGLFLLSDSIREQICSLLFVPLKNMFLQMLATFAGFMMLLSVSCGIFNMGDVSLFSKIGKNMFRRYIVFTLLVAAVVAVSCFFLFPSASSIGQEGLTGNSGLSEILNLIYSIVPGDPITPFETGNAMQIVFLGILLGVTILMLGEKAENIKNVATELNAVIMELMSMICKLLPFYIFFLIADMIWSGTFKLLLQIWKPLVITLLFYVVFLAGILIQFSIKYKVSLSVLIKKLLPTYIICVTTASSLIAFGKTTDDCVNVFGIDEKNVKIAQPIRCILFKPAFAIELVVFSFSMAQIYGVRTSISWMILDIIVCTILSIATPPVSGGTLIIFGILFPQMGIPLEAMAFAATCDVFYDFLDVAMNNTWGILENVSQAEKQKMLNKEILQSDK